MTPITDEQGVVLLNHEEGRKLVDDRARSFLGMSLEQFESCYASGKLDLDDAKVQHVMMLLPFAR
jgi:hypothetical protein